MNLLYYIVFTMKKRLFYRSLYFFVTGVLLTLSACTCMLIMQAYSRKSSKEDWPQYKKDNYRSGYTEARIDLAKFGKVWVYDTGQEPVPAWYGPAREDAYARSGPLPSMRDYDLSYYPIVVGNKLFYGSSADDAVHCHNAVNGEEIWHFTTGAPLRMAPAYYDGKLYVGSDDGYVYCLDAESGKVKWTFTPTPGVQERVLNNGRFISFYPIRTGVMIEDGIAYFGASLLPWKKSYVCAVDAENGKVGKSGTYVKVYDNHEMTLEGAMASTGKLLIQPQGRIAPVFIKKENGETAGQLSGTGGCFVLVTPERNVVHGKSSRFISMEETEIKEKQAQFMSYNDGKEMVVKGDSSYVLNDNSLVSYHRKTQRMNWLRRNFRAQRIIVAGDILFAGADDKVMGISLHNGQTIWESDVKGTVYALAFAHGHLYASTAEGYLYAFAEGGDDARYFSDNRYRTPVIDEEDTKIVQDKISDLKPRICAGPYVQPVSADSVLLTFETYDPMVVSVEWHTNVQPRHYVGESEALRHTFRLPVRKGKVYDYRLRDNNGHYADYSYDNFFNFNTRVNMVFPKASRAARRAVDDFLKGHTAEKGLCLVFGNDAGETALALAARTPMNVVGIYGQEKEYHTFVEDLQKERVYSRKLSALKVDSLQEIPILSEMADLVWVNEGEEQQPDEVIRLIAPHKLAVVTGLDDPWTWLAKATLDWQVTVVRADDGMLVLKKNPIEDIGEWSHQHGDLRNASYGGESLFGNTETSDFETQWMGRPGARFITDRSGRKPAPLAVSGRLFMQGKERIAAMSAYNGSILWMKDIPGLLRMNVARDCSNWAADSAWLYVATRQHLLQIDQQTGEICRTYTMQHPNDSAYHWGYIGVCQDRIIGTTTRKTAEFTNYHGGGNEGWYDAGEGPNSYKVVCGRIFSIGKEDNLLNWEYVPDGVIIHPTICVFDGKLLFVESFSANAETRRTGRGGNDLYADTRLVALNVETGDKIYERPFRTQEGRTAYYMAANTGKCVVVASMRAQFDIVTFEIATGEKLWQQKQKWFHGDHGAHMSKPAIVGNRLLVKPVVYDLRTGEALAYNMPKAGHGCAHYALSDHAVFYRGGSCTMYDFEARLFSKWERLRPDCWLSTIPAQGMVLSPEAAGGCSCGLWYETSMAFAPVSRTPVAILARTDDSARDYKDETWGKYYSQCNTHVFADSLKVELRLKPGMDCPIYYTVDGSEPDKTSPVYTGPVVLHESAEVKVAVYVEKGNRMRRFTRSKFFEKNKEQ